MTQEVNTVPKPGMCKGTKKAIAYAAAAFVVGVGAGWVLFWTPVPSAQEQSSASGKPLILVGENAVTVDDQVPGTTVAIREVRLREAGWVAIHESADGKPGTILGAQWFPAGTSAGSVTLLRPTVDAGTYFAVLHAGDTAKTEGRVFDPKANLMLFDDAGDPISFQFLTTMTPAAQ